MRNYPTPPLDPIRQAEIIPGVYRIKSFMVNSYLIVDGDQHVLIDTGLSGNENNIYSLIERLGKSRNALKAIFITHTDGDHCGCVNQLCNETSAIVYTSAIEAKALKNGQPSRPLQTSNRIVRLGISLTGIMFRVSSYQAQNIVHDGDEFAILGGLKIISTPGHTPGHLSFFLTKHKLLFAGDSMWKSPGGSLVPISSEINTWDKEQAIRSFYTQLDTHPVIIAAGHCIGRIKD